MATPTRKVLLCYLENKKALMLPPKAEVEDLSYLNSEFLKTFSFQSNVKLRVTFQRYDEMWGEYVDLDESDEIFDKDKLKVVVTPLLQSAASSVATVGSEGRLTVVSQPTIFYYYIYSLVTLVAQPLCYRKGGARDYIYYFKL